MSRSLPNKKVVTARCNRNICMFSYLWRTLCVRVCNYLSLILPTDEDINMCIPGEMSWQDTCSVICCFSQLACRYEIYMCTTGEGVGEGEAGQTKGSRSSRTGRGRGSRGGSGRGRRAKDGDAAALTAVPITTPASGGPNGTERPASAAGSGEGSKPKTLEVARAAVDSKGKRVWTVKDGGFDAAAGQTSSKAEGAPSAQATSSGAPE